MGHSFSLLFLFSLSYPINCFLFICFLVTTEFVSLTKLGALPNPMHFRYSFSTSSYPGIMLRRPNTPLPPQQALRHQARRYTSSLLTSAHIPQTPAAREETFVECAFYYSILCWKKSESSYQLMMRKDYKTMFMFSLSLVLFHTCCNPALVASLFGRFIWCARRSWRPYHTGIKRSSKFVPRLLLLIWTFRQVINFFLFPVFRKHQELGLALLCTKLK